MSSFRVSPRLEGLAESLTVAVDVKVKERVAQGADIINFGVGQPDFPTPAFVREAAARAVESGATTYTPPGGTPALREAAAADFVRRGIPARRETVAVTCGAKHALAEAMLAVLVPGDEVLLPVPFWVSYPEQIKLADAVAVPVSPAAGLLVTPDDLDRHRTDRTRMLLLNSPNNPSGMVYTPGEIRDLVAWCRKHDVLILSDEIYDRLTYDDAEPISPGSLGADAADRTLVVNGVSKAYSMTGWRIGFLHGPEAVIKAVIKYQGQTTGNPAAPSQAAALAALTGPQDVVEEMRSAYDARRRSALRALAEVPGLDLIEPRGAFYIFPRVTEASRAAGGSLALAGRLVEAGVAVVPGIGFGAEDHIRISYAISEEKLLEGIRRLHRGLEEITASPAAG